MQLDEGVGGTLAVTEREFAEAVVGLLKDPRRARALGAAGAERVRQRFLLPRLLEDQLRVLQRLVGSERRPAVGTAS